VSEIVPAPSRCTTATGVGATPDEAFLIAVNIAKLPSVPRHPAVAKFG
jgi:hypothetical protein